MRLNIQVIVPCFNEREVLRRTVEELLARGHQVVVVDDGSDLEASLQVSDLPVRTIRHAVNLGQGAALQTGMDYAREQGADIVVHFDADGQHSVDDIPSLLKPIVDGEADVVLGSRFLTPADRASVPWLRRLILRLARLANGILTGLWLTDAHNGLRALGPRALNGIELTENRMAHATEILQIIRRERLRWCERPAHVVYTPYSRRKGQSVLNSVNILVDLVLGKLK